MITSNRGDLSGLKREAIEAIAAVHVEAFGGNLERSLAAVPANTWALEELAGLGDPDVDETLGHLPPPTEAGHPDGKGGPCTFVLRTATEVRAREREDGL